jgi:hypothetical protein
MTKRARFTVVDLRADLSKINGWMEEHGWSERLEEGGRNGYQAVDEYSVHPDGSRNGSGVNRNVECGSARECSIAAHNHYNAVHRRRARQAEQSAQPAPAGWRNI